MLKHRLISAVVIGGLFLAGFFWQGWGGAILFTLLCTAMVVGGAAEFLALCAPVNGPGFPRFTKYYAALFAILPLVLSFVRFAGTLGLFDFTLIFLFLFIGCILVLRKPQNFAEGINRLFVSLCCIIYFCWTMSFVPRLYFLGGVDDMHGRYLALFAVLVVKSADIGAYTVGTLCSKRKGGNHKVVPNISPKKSWEGLIGGTVFSAAVAALLAYYAADYLDQIVMPVSALFLGVVASLVGFAGDLVESALKRAGGAKDSGVIPGLGGVLDITDSIIFFLPVFFVYVLLRLVFA